MVRLSRLVPLAVGGLALAAVGWNVRQNRETARVQYEILDRVGDVEIRRYPRAVVVETVADSEGIAFGRLFRYISGTNRARREIEMTAPVASREARHGSGETIAMTAPVETSRVGDGDAPVGDRDSDGTAGDGAVRMAFYLPEEYDATSAPEPTDSTVRLVEVPERTVAVLGFSWYATDRRVARKSMALLRTLEDGPFHVLGEPFLLRYEAPWTPPFLRTNEVAVEVERSGTRS